MLVFPTTHAPYINHADEQLGTGLPISCGGNAPPPASNSNQKMRDGPAKMHTQAASMAPNTQRGTRTHRRSIDLSHTTLENRGEPGLGRLDRMYIYAPRRRCPLLVINQISTPPITPPGLHLAPFHIERDELQALDDQQTAYCRTPTPTHPPAGKGSIHPSNSLRRIGRLPTTPEQQQQHYTLDDRLHRTRGTSSSPPPTIHRRQ